MDIETHPHKPFIPPHPRFLILGSFPGKNNVCPKGDEWFYSAPRNQFWKILSHAFDVELKNTQQKKKLFTDKGIGIGDILLKIRRKHHSNSDSDLIILEYNTQALQQIFESYTFERIFFTSRFVEKEFKKLFALIENCESLPSPSPRYARMSFEQKVEVYKQKLK